MCFLWYRLKEPEPAQKAGFFPRFGSKFRYSGRTQYQTRQQAALIDRTGPDFDRGGSRRFPASRTVDGGMCFEFYLLTNWMRIRFRVVNQFSVIKSTIMACVVFFVSLWLGMGLKKDMFVNRRCCISSQHVTVVLFCDFMIVLNLHKLQIVV